MVDVGREAVYAAEIAAFEGTRYESLTDFEDLLETAAEVERAGWWPRGQIEVTHTRRDASSSSTRQRGSNGPVVRLAASQMTPATLIHELAHVLAGVNCGHDQVFRRAHIDLAASLFGEEPATWLLHGYRSMGLEPGDRTWPAPPARRVAGGPVESRGPVAL